jgi:hypothetical protein
MHPFISDAIELALFRGKNVEQYHYDWRLPVAWVTLIACLPAFNADFLQVDLAGRLLFFTVLGWTQTLALVAFLGWWLRLGGRWQGGHSLFPLLVLTDAPLLLLLPLNMLPPDAGGLVLPLFLVYYLAVKVSAVRRASGVTLGHVIFGFLAYAPIYSMLGMLMINFLLEMGWVDQKALAEIKAEAANIEAVQTTEGGH